MTADSQADYLTKVTADPDSPLDHAACRASTGFRPRLAASPLFGVGAACAPAGSASHPGWHAPRRAAPGRFARRSHCPSCPLAPARRHPVEPGLRRPCPAGGPPARVDLLQKKPWRRERVASRRGRPTPRSSTRRTQGCAARRQPAGWRSTTDDADRSFSCRAAHADVASLAWRQLDAMPRRAWACCTQPTTQHLDPREMHLSNGEALDWAVDAAPSFCPRQTRAESGFAHGRSKRTPPASRCRYHSVQGNP